MLLFGQMYKALDVSKLFHRLDGITRPAYRENLRSRGGAAGPAGGFADSSRFPPNLAGTSRYLADKPHFPQILWRGRLLNTGHTVNQAMQQLLILSLVTAVFSACRSLPAPLDIRACLTKEKMLKIRGDSLAGLIEDGAVMRIIMGYYKCHEVGRGDIVVYDYPGGEPLAKIAQGVPGDRFRLEKSRPGCWGIRINGKILKNSQKAPYCIGEHGYRMLSSYEKSYDGVIPQDACLILGNQPEGTLDSTRFGLVSRADLLGRAMPLAGDLKLQVK